MSSAWSKWVCPTSTALAAGTWRSIKAGSERNARVPKSTSRAPLRVR
jgi:hypothetical protein